MSENLKPDHKIVSFDLDDTIIGTTGLFEQAQEEFANWMFKTINGKVKTSIDEKKICQIIKELQHTIDRKYTSELGPSNANFPRSFYDSSLIINGFFAGMTWFRDNEETLNLDKTRKDRDYDLPQEEVDQACKRGKSVFLSKEGYEREGMIDGAKEVLDFLAEQPVKLLLITLGEKVLQQKKIAGNNLSRWFNESDIYIVGEKNEDSYSEILSNYADLENKADLVYHIGDSMKSDVVSALEAGINAVHLPYDNVTYDGQIEEISDSSRYTQLKSITDLKREFDF